MTRLRLISLKPIVRWCSRLESLCGEDNFLRRQGRSGEDDGVVSICGGGSSCQQPAASCQPWGTGCEKQKTRQTSSESQKTILVSTDPAHSLSDIFQQKFPISQSAPLLGE